MFEPNEDADLSQPAHVELSTLFDGVTLTSVTEMALGGNIRRGTCTTTPLFTQ